MHEPSLLDLLKQVMNRQRLSRWALLLAGLYLLGSGIGKLIRPDGSEMGSVIRLALGIVSLAAIRFIRSAQCAPSTNGHGEKPAGCRFILG